VVVLQVFPATATVTIVPLRLWKNRLHSGANRMPYPANEYFEVGKKDEDRVLNFDYGKVVPKTQLFRTDGEPLSPPWKIKEEFNQLKPWLIQIRCTEGLSKETESDPEDHAPKRRCSI
jgi:hypothetical protein